MVYNLRFFFFKMQLVS